MPIYVPGLQSVGLDSASLCYEIHGEDDQYFNLVSDCCTSVNAHYVSINDYLNVVDEVAIRVVDDIGQCRNIRIDLEGCSASIDGMTISSPYRAFGVTVRPYQGRVRISTPNCDSDITLVMWTICQNNTIIDPFTYVPFRAQMIKFVIARGINLNESSHGLIGRWSFSL